MSLDRHLPLGRTVSTRTPDVSLVSTWSAADALMATDQTLVIMKPDDYTWRDWSVFLLHSGAEVEHALLVQYLYAAFSLRPGLSDPSDPAITTNGWYSTLAQIAKEEMGHLLTLQNILRSLGAPLNFEREDMPFRSKLYPFPFRLERLTKLSLAKYVVAEMPPSGVSETVLPADERRRIIQLATADNGGVGVNQVGLLYRTLRYSLEQLGDTAFFPDPMSGAGMQFQSGETDWQNNTSEDPSLSSGIQIKTLRIRDKATALQAIDVVAQQGEGMDADNVTGSHFERFLAVFRNFPPEGASWSPTFMAPTDPNTVDPPNATTILHPLARKWAEIFNLRYRILLVSLSQAMATPVSTDRGLLINWVFEEMSTTASTLRDLAVKLLGLDLDEASGRKAGAPFEMPYSLALPDRENDRWRFQRDLILASRQLIDALPSDPILADIRDRDGQTDGQGRRKAIAERLTS